MPEVSNKSNSGHKWKLGNLLKCKEKSSTVNSNCNEQGTINFPCPDNVNDNHAQTKERFEGIRSQTPSDCGEGRSHLFHMTLRQLQNGKCMNPSPKPLNTHKSYTFSKNEMYKIDLENRKLLEKIMNVRPFCLDCKRTKQLTMSAPPSTLRYNVKPRSLIQRQQYQRHIDRENWFLAKHIEEIQRKRRFD